MKSRAVSPSAPARGTLGRIAERVTRWGLPLVRYPRTVALALTCVALLTLMATSLGTSAGPSPRFVAYASAALGLVCAVDSLCSLNRKRAADERRLRTVETAWLECHIELRLLERWLHEHGLQVQTQELAKQELRRQLSLPSPDAGEPS